MVSSVFGEVLDIIHDMAPVLNSYYIASSQQLQQLVCPLSAAMAACWSMGCAMCQERLPLPWLPQLCGLWRKQPKSFFFDGGKQPRSWPCICLCNQVLITDRCYWPRISITTPCSIVLTLLYSLQATTSIFFFLSSMTSVHMDWQAQYCHDIGSRHM